MDGAENFSYDLFADIAGELAYRRKLSMEERDIYLQDFSKAWALEKDSDGRGYQGGTPPPGYVAQWQAITGPESNYSGQQHKGWSGNGGGCSFTVNDSGGLVLHQGQSVITVTANVLAEFAGLVQTALAQSRAVQPASAGQTARVLSHNEKVVQSDPILRERARRNRQEEWKASQPRYPQWS